VGVVIFTRNEINTIGYLIDQVVKLIDKEDIFVIDGHSTDQTISVVEEKKVPIYLDNKKGKGAAIRLAIKEVKRDVLVFMDSDGSHRPEEIPLLLGPLASGNSIDMVIGSRFKGNSEEFLNSPEEVIRLIGNLLSTLFINIVWNAQLTDTQNGFRAVRRDAMAELSLVEDSFAIEQEMVIKCLKKRKKIVEIPSFEKRRAHNRSHIIPFKMLPKYIACFARNIFPNV